MESVVHTVPAARSKRFHPFHERFAQRELAVEPDVDSATVTLRLQRGEGRTHVHMITRKARFGLLRDTGERCGDGVSEAARAVRPGRRCQTEWSLDV